MKKLTLSIFLASSLLVFNGCQKNLGTPQERKIDANLPVVDSQSIRFIPDYKSVAIEWKSIKQPEVKGYNIYRADIQIDGKKFKRIAQIDSRYASHYLDETLEPDTKYAYTISAKGVEDSESTESKPMATSTLPLFESVSLIEAISGLPRQIKLLWRPHTSPRISKYIIQRTTPKTSKWEDLKTINGRYIVEYIDEGLGDKDIYIYRIIAVTFDGVASKPSEMVKASTKPLPLHIKGIAATKDLPRKIKISWEKSPTEDVVLYNIYRSSSVDGSYSVVAQAPAEHNTFEDTINEDGKIYFYKVTPVDKDELEAKIKEATPAMGSTLSKPAMPLITLAQIQGDRIILNWQAGDDRAVSYNVFKTKKEGWSANEESIPNVVGLRFEDPDIVRGVEYRFSIQAVDKFGLVSEKTEELTSMLPKIDDTKVEQQDNQQQVK